jgi:hypothetical protein
MHSLPVDRSHDPKLSASAPEYGVPSNLVRPPEAKPPLRAGSGLADRLLTIIYRAVDASRGRFDF